MLNGRDHETSFICINSSIEVSTPEPRPKSPVHHSEGYLYSLKYLKSFGNWYSLSFKPKFRYSVTFYFYGKWRCCYDKFIHFSRNIHAMMYRKGEDFFPATHNFFSQEIKSDNLFWTWKVVTFSSNFTNWSDYFLFFLFLLLSFLFNFYIFRVKIIFL